MGAKKTEGQKGDRKVAQISDYRKYPASRMGKGGKKKLLDSAIILRAGLGEGLCFLRKRGETADLEQGQSSKNKETIRLFGNGNTRREAVLKLYSSLTKWQPHL